jgi:hypothetical protein
MAPKSSLVASLARSSNTAATLSVTGSCGPIIIPQPSHGSISTLLRQAKSLMTLPEMNARPHMSKMPNRFVSTSPARAAIQASLPVRNFPGGWP